MAEAARRPELARAIDDARTLAAQLDALRSAEPAAAPDDLVERAARHAMRARAEYDARPARRWDWLWEPVTLRVRVASILVGAALVATAWFASPRVLPRVNTPFEAGEVAAVPATPRERAAEPARAATGAEEPSASVAVRFVLPARGAARVAVAGDFNRWRTEDSPLRDDDGDGVFVGTLRLPPGTYAYMFVVDGERWVSDPYATNFREDDFGNQNAVLRIN